MGVLLYSLSLSGCQLTDENDYPLEGLWSHTMYSPPHEQEYAFFSDGAYESIAYTLNPNTGERTGIVYAATGAYHLMDDRIQFRIGRRTPHVEFVPIDSLNYLNDLLIRPGESNGGEQWYSVTDTELTLQHVCGINENCPGPRTFTFTGFIVKRLQ